MFTRKFDRLGRDVLPGEVRVGVLVADQAAEGVLVAARRRQREPRPVLARPARVVVLVRGEDLHQRQRFA